MTPLVPRPLGAVALLLAFALVVAACGGATATPTGAPAATPVASSAPGASPSAAAVCADASAFRASVATLTSLKLVEVGTSGVKSAVADVKTSAEALLVSGKDVLGPPLTDLLTAVSGLEATLASLGNQSGLGSALSAIRASITEVKTSATALDQTLTSTCPGQ